MIATAPPAEEDDVHTETNRPTLTATAPLPNAAIVGRDVLVEGTVSAPRGVTRIEAHVDGIAAALFAPSPDGGFRQSVRLPAIIARGTHELRVTAYDDVGNNRSVAIPMDVQSDREPITISWEQPADGATLTTDDFPMALVLRMTSASGANRLEIHLTDTTGAQLLTSVVPQTTGETRVLWPHAPPPGAVTLRARLLAGDILLAESGERRITVAP